MDIALILTTVGTGVAVIGTNVALISWIRSDMKSFETEMRGSMKSFEGEIRGWKEEISKEMKDFHGRLCSLEGEKK